MRNSLISPHKTGRADFVSLILFCFLILEAITLSTKADELLMKDGSTLKGIILKTDGKTLTLQMVVGSGQAEVPYPLATIKAVRFTNEAKVQAILDSNDLTDLTALQQVWEKRQPYLGLPESDAGEIGLRYVKLLLAKKTKKAAGEALELAQAVEQGDWSATRKNEATRLRLSALAATGKVEQAMAEAEKMQNVSGGDESALASARVQARFVQADLFARKLGELEKDWPKWQLMAEKRKERWELYNAAIDGFLFPSVFHPELTRYAAEGLWKAAELYFLNGRGDDAVILADEMINWFPEAEFKGKALELKKKVEKAGQGLKEKEKKS